MSAEPDLAALADEDSHAFGQHQMMRLKP